MKAFTNDNLTHCPTIPTFITSGKESFRKHCGKKRENALNQPFPTMFSTLPNTNFYFSVTMTLSSANALNLVKAKILSFGKELNVAQVIRFAFDGVENIVGKGENVGFQHFLLFP